MMKDLRFRKLMKTGLLAMAISFLIGCAGGPKSPPAMVGATTGEISMRAWNHAFDPSVIKVQKPGPLVLRVENISESTHNITVDDPQGNKMISVDLPPHKIVAVNLRLPAAGTYKFYCDKPLHSTLGMKGQIEVGQ